MEIKNRIKLLNKIEDITSNKIEYFKKKNKVFEKIFSLVYGNEIKNLVTYEVSVQNDTALYCSNMPFVEYEERYREGIGNMRNTYYYDVFRITCQDEHLTIPIPLFLILLERFRIMRTEFFKNVTFYKTVNRIPFVEKLDTQSEIIDLVMWSSINNRQKAENFRNRFKELKVLTISQIEQVISQLDLNNQYKFRVITEASKFAEEIKLYTNTFSHSWAGDKGIETFGTLIIGGNEFSFGKDSTKEYSNNGDTQEPIKENYEGDFDITKTYVISKEIHDWDDYNHPCYPHDDWDYEVVIYSPLLGI